MSAAGTNFDLVLKLNLPKFSKDYTYRDFLDVLQPILGCTEKITLGRRRYPNQWTLTVSNEQQKVKLLQKGTLTIQGKKCVVSPFGENEVCGRIHWLPSTVPDSAIKDCFKTFGDFVFFELETIASEEKEIHTSTRFFIFKLNTGYTVAEIPHYITVSSCDGLVTVKGRDPLCYGCDEVGHKKHECKSLEIKAKRSQRRKKKRKELALATQAAKQSLSVKSEETISTKTTDSVPVAVPSTSQANLRNQDAIRNVLSAPINNMSNIVRGVDDIQSIMNAFSQKIIDALSNVNLNDKADAIPSTSGAGASSSENKRRKKKKKKTNNANCDEQDLVETDSKTEVNVSNVIQDQNVPLCSRQPPASLAAVHVSEANEEVNAIPAANGSDDTSANKKKKNKKKKKKGQQTSVAF